MTSKKHLTPVKAIRAYCIECSGGAAKDVRECPVERCLLFLYRMGKRPKINSTAKKVELARGLGEKVAGGDTKVLPKSLGEGK